MNWERMAAVRTGALMLLAILVLIGGVGTGAFLICIPAGWITVGVLGFIALCFLAFVSDPDAMPKRPVTR